MSWANRAAPRTQGERGAVAVWTSVALLACILVLGIGVDFSGHARAAQQVRSVAREAARAGGDAVRPLQGEAPRLDPVLARRQAERYVLASGHTGVAHATETTVETTVRSHYECRFLSIIGIWRIPVEESGTATLVSSYGGELRQR